MTENFEYETNSFAGQLPPGRIAEFEIAYSHWIESPDPVRFPADYVKHISTCHGGVPLQKCFRTTAGNTRAIGRFLNFLRSSDPIPLPFVQSWRGGSRDIRLDYSIYYVGPMGEQNVEALGPNLVPFAGLDTNGHDCRTMAAFDMLCFDFQNKKIPRIVTWSAQNSRPDHPITEPVTESFTTLLAMMHRCPPQSPSTQDQINSY